MTVAVVRDSRLLVEKVARRLSKASRVIRSTALTPALALASRLSRRSLVDPSSGTDISLTSYGARLSRVHLTVESIGQGRCRPARLILYVDPEIVLDELPKQLLQLRQRGLEIENSPKRYGPHTKYYPYVASRSERTRALITADDDTLYPRDWMLLLEEASATSGKDVLCYRAHRIEFAEDGSLRPYNSWGPVRTQTASYRNFATGVSGVRYPTELLDRLAEAGEEFMRSCPLADDIWLHHIAVSHSFRIRQLGAAPKKFPEILSSQREALHRGNTGQSGNDRQIADTYTVLVRNRILEEEVS